MRPWEFMRLTPRELRTMVDVAREQECGREREQWRRVAFLTAEIINISGKTIKGRIRPDQLIKFDEDPERAPEPVVDSATRRRQAQETLIAHKKKFWMKFKDESVAKLTGGDHG